MTGDLGYQTGQFIGHAIGNAFAPIEVWLSSISRILDLPVDLGFLLFPAWGIAIVIVCVWALIDIRRNQP